MKLQADRLRRMRGGHDAEIQKRPKHLSADDLADGFILDKDDRQMLSYKVCFATAFSSGSETKLGCSASRGTYKDKWQQPFCTKVTFRCSSFAFCKLCCL